MLVLDTDNSYSFANMTVKITDHTIDTGEVEQVTYPLPDFNVLIPTVQAVGSTNTLEIYAPGGHDSYVRAHGKPNPLKYGFGPDFIYGILSKDAGVGVYTINLRGDTATLANIVVLLKYRVEKDVPYTDTEGNPYYVDSNGQLTTVPTDATPVVRDVLHTKFTTAHIEDAKKWTDIHRGMNNLIQDTEDEDGYKTMPFFGVMYRGASDFGNNVYFNMVPNVAEYDGNTYYTVTCFDGVNTTATDNTLSLDTQAGEKYDASYFIETQFNAFFPTMRFMIWEGIDEIYNLYNQYLFSLDDYMKGAKAPTDTFGNIDPFTANTFMIQVDGGSLNSQITNAFKLSGGFDGTETPDQLYADFFAGKIQDVSSVLRYKIHYIPDTGYDEATKKNIVNLVAKRNRMTTATIMVGEDTFASALLDHQANFYDNMPNIRQIAKVQSPMMYNTFIRRTITYPASYFDTMALMDHFKKWGNYYQPFAGADARWTGYIEDTMHYPTESPEFMTSLYNSRINVVMKDDQEGSYLSDQLMSTVLTSDQTEFNNAFLISSMLYDLLNLVHRNHFKFNEAQEIQMFQVAVNDCVNEKYTQYSASLSVDVHRMGTIGRARFANKIIVTIDMKDINKYTSVELILTDE